MNEDSIKSHRSLTDIQAILTILDKQNQTSKMSGKYSKS